jgi:hypothetical protein
VQAELRALVMLNFLIRHEQLTAKEEPDYREVRSRIHTKPEILLLIVRM